MFTPQFSYDILLWTAVKKAGFYRYFVRKILEGEKREMKTKNTFKPMLLTSLKNYSASQFTRDVIAGIIVAVIALPLSIALALASGVGPEAGIYTAIVAGFVISALGGSTVQIASLAFLVIDKVALPAVIQS